MASIEWSVYGKIKKVTRTTGSSKADLEFGYDAGGNRLWKKVVPKGSGAIVKTYYYLRDAQGTEMCRYISYTNTSSQTLLVSEEHGIYGSSRLGIDQRRDTLFLAGAYNPTWCGTSSARRELGNKHYELSNHLGNVLLSITDKKAYKTLSGSLYFEAEITTISDYYPFGSTIQTRAYSAVGYRWGFNGKEKEDETYEGCLVFEARIFDARLGRFLSLDPRMSEYAWQTPFAYFKNSPILIIDYMGKGNDDNQPDGSEQRSDVDNGINTSNNQHDEVQIKDTKSPDNPKKTAWRMARWTVKMYWNYGAKRNWCKNLHCHRLSSGRKMQTPGKIWVKEAESKVKFGPWNCDQSITGGAGGSPTDPGTVPPMALPGSAPATNPCQIPLFNDNELSYPGATRGLATGISTISIVNVTVPRLPANCINARTGGQQGTISVVFANDLAMPTPSGSDGIANSALITNMSTGQSVFWPMTLTVGFQNWNLTARPGDNILIIIVPQQFGIVTDRFTCTGFFSVP